MKSYQDVANLDAFCGAVVFDKWVANAGERRAGFVHSGSGAWTDPEFRAFDKHGRLRRRAWVATLIDHRLAFGGPQWRFADDPSTGIFKWHVVYQGVRSFDSFNPWLDRILGVSPTVLDAILKCVPTSWVDAQDELERLLERLYARRRMVPDLIRKCKNGPLDPFPNWS
jgi:hypothetical protein